MSQPIINPAALPGRPRLLVRGVNWLGDAVMTTPALLRLREALPGTEITLLTHEKFADLWRDHPAVDALITFTDQNNLWQIALRLRREKFGTALVLPNSTRAALEVWLGGVPRRIGYAGRGRHWLLTETLARPASFVPMHKRTDAEIKMLVQNPPRPAPPPPMSAHHMHHYLHLAGALGAKTEPLAPLIPVSEFHLVGARSKLQITGAPRLILGLNAGAEYGPAKRWPPERFVSTMLELRRRTGCHWVLFGGRGDIPLANHIAGEIDKGTNTHGRHSPVLNLAGQTSLMELCALLKYCRVLLTNDTGPMHLAAAVGTPVVVPFGSTSPELTGPGLPGDPRHRLLKSDAPCSPCFLRQCPVDFRCLRGIGVDQVAAAVLQVIENSPA